MTNFKALTVLVAALAFTGCSHKNASIPNAAIPFAAADYTVMGKTNAEECASYIVGIDFAHLFSDTKGTISGGGGGRDPISAIVGTVLGGGMGPEEGRALYTALEKMPEATHLLAPRVLTTEKGVVLPFIGLMLFGERCAVVDARGVVIGEKPLPIFRQN